MKRVSVLLSVFLVAGCVAPEPLRVQPAQESFSLHDGKTCKQMEQEYRLELARREVFTDLQEKKVEDEGRAHTMLAVYSIPTLGLSFLPGILEFVDGDYKDELAEAKGAVISLEEVMFRDGCEVGS